MTAVDFKITKLLPTGNAPGNKMQMLESVPV